MREISEQDKIDYLNKQFEYFDKNIKPIMNLYEGQFILIHYGRVIDSDKDKGRLEKRFAKRDDVDFDFPPLIMPVPRSRTEYSAQLMIRRLASPLESPIICEDYQRKIRINHLGERIIKALSPDENF